jgi:ATP-binding cassette subfamily B protein
MKNIFKVLVYSKQLWPYYAAISVFTILLSLMSLLQPLLSGWAIDEISKGSDAQIKYVVYIAIGIFLLEVLSTIFSNIGGYLGDQMSARLNKYLSSKYYQHLLELPQSYFDSELSGKIINRLNRSITQITNFMQMMSNNFLQFIFSTVFSLIVVAYYSWQVALLLFTLYPIYIGLTLKTSNTWLKYQAKKNTQLDIATGRFAESINQIKVVKSYIQEKREINFFSRHMQKMININKPQSAYWHKRDVQRRLILNLIFFGVYLFIFVQAAKGLYSPGVAVALILYAMQIRIPIFTISFLVENTQKAVADSKDYFEIMSMEPIIADIVNAEPLNVNKGNIDFKNVRFSYGKQEVLKGLTFTVVPDSKVALVGESGEGKTTITNLLIRLYEPTAGNINIDNQDITKVTQNSLRDNIAVVFQDPALFSGTIYENIAYANPSATKNDIIKAAKAANAEEFILKLDKGYDTQIGERGLKLSGGQKQRISIARALLKDAPILILDEATSSLDSRSEALVQIALDKLMKGRTTIIIAHRLTTIAGVDKIVTLKNGKIDEQGSPKELAKTNGIYARLLQISSRHDEKAKKQLKEFEIAN